MAFQKRKAVAKSANQLFGGKRARSAAQEEEQQEVEEQEEGENEEEQQEEQQQQEEEEESEEDRLAREEEELTAARKKELKAMPVNDLKDLVTSKGLEAAKKEDMVSALLTHETEARAAERAHRMKIREVLIKKKDELEALSAPDLKDLCNAAGAKGIMKKEKRIALLLKHWQDDDGVDKAIAKMARDAREAVLAGMDKEALRNLCERSGVDAFVKEVIVDRVVRHEQVEGRFDKPKPAEQEEEETAQQPAKASKADMVDTLLANEASRKREREQKRQEEEAAANKRKELRSMNIEELKKLLTKKGKEATGKKEDLVEAMFAVSMEEDAAAARKAKLKALSPEELKQRVASKGLQLQQGWRAGKEAMVEALLGHESDLKKAAEEWDLKVGEELAKKRAEFEDKTAGELKDLCAEGSLKLGIGKQERVETLLEAAQASGEFDKIVAAVAKDARRQELLAMARAEVLEIGEAAGVDVLVKEIMVERILLHEDEFGVCGGEEKRPGKRARTGGKT